MKATARSQLVTLALLFAMVGARAVEARPAVAPEAATSAAPSADAPTVTVTNPGRGPARLLRLTARKGMKRSLTMLMEMAIEMSMGGKQLPATRIPVIKMVMDIVVTDVASNGDIRYEFVLRKPQALRDPAVSAQAMTVMQASMDGLAGMTGFGVVTDRGFTKDADIVVPVTANAQTQQLVGSIRQSLNQLAAPLPAEPVGLGAIWETSSTISQNGMVITQVATNEVKALKGKQLKLGISLTQTAKPQTFTSNGAKVNLESFASSGTGASTLDLGALIPSAAKVALHSDMAMETMGQKMAMKLDVLMTMK